MTRPKKAPADKREIVLRVRVTEDERAQLQAAADHERLDLSTWLRRLGLNEAVALSDRAAKKAAKRG
jgi:uncharacterized protein (DUF1778 family)